MVAARTAGFAGADLANLVNEAALLAARKDKTAVEPTDFDEAIDRLIAGLEKKRVMSTKEREIVAYHESGHAIVATSIPGMDPVHKISIVQRGFGALGYTMQLPLEDRYLMQRKDLLNQLAVLLGGRTAEEIALGEISTGAQNDLLRATDIARAMVTEWGMSDALGAINYDGHKRSKFLEMQIGPERGAYAEDTGRLIDSEVKRIMTDAHDEARRSSPEARHARARDAAAAREGSHGRRRAAPPRRFRCRRKSSAEPRVVHASAARSRFVFRFDFDFPATIRSAPRSSAVVLVPARRRAPSRSRRSSPASPPISAISSRRPMPSSSAPAAPAAPRFIQKTRTSRNGSARRPAGASASSRRAPRLAMASNRAPSRSACTSSAAPRTARVGALGADLVDAQIVNGVLTQGIKAAVNRTRPNGSNHSFPSGHTSATFATAAVIQQHYGWKVAAPFYALGGYVSVVAHGRSPALRVGRDLRRRARHRLGARRQLRPRPASGGGPPV